MKQVTSIFLSIVMLVSSMGITFTTHFCMGRAIDSQLMIGAHELSCGMMDMDNSCETEGVVVSSSACCDNGYISIDIEDDYELNAQEVSFDPSFLYALSYTFLLSNSQTSELNTASDHHPPPLERDYQSLYQSFLL